jgi:hypothetical protein
MTFQVKNFEVSLDSLSKWLIALPFAERRDITAMDFDIRCIIPCMMFVLDSQGDDLDEDMEPIPSGLVGLSGGGVVGAPSRSNALSEFSPCRLMCMCSL